MSLETYLIEVGAALGWLAWLRLQVSRYQFPIVTSSSFGTKVGILDAMIWRNNLLLKT